MNARNIKWKSGIILFLFLFGVGNTFLNLFPPKFYSLAYSYRSPIELQIMWEVVLIISLTLTFIYLISLSLSEKIIFENRYNLRHFWGVALLEFGVLYLLYGVYSIVRFRFYIGVSHLINYGLPLTFVLVILFSIIPSYLYFKWHSTRKVLIAFYSLLAVVVMMYGYRFTSVFTCDFNSNFTCLAQRKDDVNICDRENRAFLKNNCVLAFSRRSSDVNICGKIMTEEGIPMRDDPFYYNRTPYFDCVVSIAKNLNDPQLCTLVPQEFEVYQIERGGPNRYGDCYSVFNK